MPHCLSLEASLLKLIKTQHQRVSNQQQPPHWLRVEFIPAANAQHSSKGKTIRATVT